jgi:hypothetical protein
MKSAKSHGAAFTRLRPGEHYVFIGLEAQYQTFVADHFIRSEWRRNPDVSIYYKHLKSGETLPTHQRFETARSILETEPGSIVVSSAIRPKFTPLDDYRHLDAIFVECSATTSAYVVELKLGDAISYWRGDAKFHEFIPCAKPENPHNAHLV